MLDKNSLGLLKKGAAKQSRIKTIVRHLLRRTNCNYVVVLVIAIDVMLLYCAHACTSRLNMCVIVVLTRVVHSVP